MMKSVIALAALVALLMAAPLAMAVVPIYDIQYTTDPEGLSPEEGNIVEVQGIVTAKIGDLYYLQDAAAAWSGIYVYDWYNGSGLGAYDPVEVGDEVKVSALVQEYYYLTELYFDSDPNTNAGHSFEKISTGNALPAAQVLTVADLTGEYDNLSVEQWEGVLVRVENVECVVNCGQAVIDLNYGEWSVDTDPNTGYLAIGDNFKNYGFYPALGEEFAFIQGPLDYSYDEFKIQPRGFEDFDRTDWAGAPDWNADGVIDGKELLMWQRGESPGFGDPDLDPGELPWWDLDDWELYYGEVEPSPISAVAAAVPEPATGLLLILGMTAMLFRRA